MTSRPVLEPTAEHPITINPTGTRVVVRVNGEVVADSYQALQLQESTYPAVQYIPFKDVRQDRLTRTDTSTYCPYTGEAGYYRVRSAAGSGEDVICPYEQPYPAVAAIAGHVAFYPDKADISVDTG